jgi:hypothetical protein
MNRGRDGTGRIVGRHLWITCGVWEWLLRDIYLLANTILLPTCNVPKGITTIPHFLNSDPALQLNIWKKCRQTHFKKSTVSVKSINF